MEMAIATSAARDLTVLTNGDDEKMATEPTLPPMEAGSILTKVTPEIMNKVFARPSLQHARLVCKQFATFGRPFLCTRAVVASRFSTLHHLENLLAHQYFKTTVQELLLDMSTFRTQICMEACCKSTRASASSERWQDLAPLDADVAAHPFGRGPVIILFGTEVRMPLGRGWAGREQRVADEETILAVHQRGGIRPEQIWRQAISRAASGFPNLKKIVVADYRLLARDQDHTTLCRRLFGDILEPNAAGPKQLVAALHILFELDAVHEVKVLTLGSSRPICEANRFAHLASFEFTRDTEPWPLETINYATPTSLLSFRISYQHLSCLNNTKRRLRQLILFMSSHLQSLAIFCAIPWRARQSCDCKASAEFNAIFFEQEKYFHLKLPDLHTLELRGMAMSKNDLFTVLAKHSESLRSLLLIECDVFECGGLGDQSVAEWVAANMSLTSLEIIEAQ